MMASDEVMMAEEKTAEDEKTGVGDNQMAMAGEAVGEAERPKYTAQQIIVATMLGSPNFQKR